MRGAGNAGAVVLNNNLAALFRLPGRDDQSAAPIVGEGVLTASGAMAPIRVGGSAKAAGAFTFYLSAE